VVIWEYLVGNAIEWRYKGMLSFSVNSDIFLSIFCQFRHFSINSDIVCQFGRVNSAVVFLLPADGIRKAYLNLFNQCGTLQNTCCARFYGK